MNTPKHQPSRTLSMLFLAVLSFVAVSCSECGECKECVFDPNIAEEDWECGAYEEYCGADLENRRSSDIFRCK
jgi:hypothetical protein